MIMVTDMMVTEQWTVNNQGSSTRRIERSGLREDHRHRDSNVHQVKAVALICNEAHIDVTDEIGDF